MAIPLGKPSDKADRTERRPGLGLAQRGAGRGASCSKKHRQSRRSCCRFRTPSFADRVAAAVPSGCGKMRRLRRCAPRCRSAPRTRSRAAWCGPGRRRLRSITWSGACAAAPASGPWANESQPRYDLRRAPRIHPHFASNAIRGGLNQRFLTILLSAIRFQLESGAASH